MAMTTSTYKLQAHIKWLSAGQYLWNG